LNIIVKKNKDGEEEKEFDDFDDLDDDKRSSESFDEAVERMGGKNGRLFELMTI
jgi:hypothetical protein